LSVGEISKVVTDYNPAAGCDPPKQGGSRGTAEDRRQSPERRTIRLFPDYGRDWPLWENTTPTWDVGYTTSPECYGLSERLTRELAAWNNFWEAHFDPMDGWDMSEHRERWATEGERIRDLLSAEVASFADVVYEPWPLPD
jgi:hypothetical protein